MNLSEKGIRFLKRAEGFRACIYEDAGHWAIGYGCQVEPETWRKVRMTESQAETLLRVRLRDVEAAIAESVTVPLEQHQYDALASLCFNCGAAAFQSSTLVRKLNEGDLAGAAKEFPRWIYSQRKPSEGLKARREKEQRIFLGEIVEEYGP